MKRLIVPVFAVLLLAGCASKSPQDLLTKHDKEIDKIIAQMTLEEKVNGVKVENQKSKAKKGKEEAK